MKTKYFTSHFSASNLVFMQMSGSTAENKNPRNDSSFDLANGYYSSFHSLSKAKEQSEMLSCFASKLAAFILGFLGKRKHVLKNNALPDSFYRRCLKQFLQYNPAFCKESNGTMLVALKQMMHILRAAGIVQMESGKTFACDINTETISFYYMLFDAFWNRVEWQDIFPADEEAAAALQADKSMLTDILYRQKGPVDINYLANEFFDLTGFANQGDIEAIGFLDFYLFFWLKNFNIINYSDTDAGITVELTGAGKKIISAMRR